MENRWSDDKAAQALAKYGHQWGSDLALGLYAASLIGSEDKLVLHGGGNSSVKTERVNIHGERIDTIYVKASGYNMACIEPDGYACLDLKSMKKLRAINELSDENMTNEFCAHMLDARSAAPSIETLVHVFIAGKYVDHTHPDAILALSNQVGGEKHLRQALGEKVAIIDYYSPGFKLAKAVAEALDKSIFKIEEAILKALETTPPELAGDIYRRGLYLTGGGALLRGLDKRLSQKIKLPVHIADDPLKSVVRGTGIALKNYDRYPFVMR